MLQRNTSSLSLLDEPIFSVRGHDGREARLSLPELLAACAGNRVDCLLSLRPHQEAMFHAFMVSLAFMAMESAGDVDATELATDAGRWREMLRGLTPDYPDDEPWKLLVSDWTKPGFMQSPCADSDVLQYTGLTASPQELDVLVTSKSHDIKPGKLGGFGAKHAGLWVHALITLHADGVYMPAGQKAASCYPSVRKNAGVAARPQFRLVFERGVGAEFCRDVAALFLRRSNMYESARAVGLTGPAIELLAWLKPWEHPFQAKSLHPLFLEVTRRVRLVVLAQGAIAARTAPSANKGWRTQFESHRGVMADPWAPVVRDSEGDKALNPQSETGGFTYRRLAPVLFDREHFMLPLLARPVGAEALRGGTMVARALGRGQGGTDGYLSREVHFPPTAMRRTADDSALLALRSQSFMQTASDMQGKVLRSALIQYVDGSDDPNWKRPEFGRSVKTWEVAFDAAVDEIFFEELLDTIEQQQGDDEALLRWARRLRALAQNVFERAVDSLPTRDRSSHLARARAQSFLRSALRKRFPALFAEARPGEGAEAAGTEINDPTKEDIAG